MGAGETSGLSNAGGGKQPLAGSSRARLRRDGPSRAEPSQTGPRHPHTGPNIAVYLRRGIFENHVSRVRETTTLEGKAEPSRAELNRAEPSRAKLGRAGLGQAAPNRTELGRDSPARVQIIEFTSKAGF